MGIFFNLAKNVTTNLASNSFKIAKAVKDKLEDEIEIAKLETLEKREQEFNEVTKHLSREEKEKIKQLQKHFSLVDTAKANASRANELRRLRTKYDGF